MIAKNYTLIQEISKELGMNDGKGWSYRYIRAVLSEEDKRSNEEIEIIASALNEATANVKEQLIKDFNSFQKGKAHWVRVIAKRLNEKREVA